MRVVVALLGAACLGGGILLLVRHRLKVLAVLAIIAGALLVLWVVALARARQRGRRAQDLDRPGRRDVVPHRRPLARRRPLPRVARPSRPSYPIFFAATSLFILTFLDLDRAGLEHRLGAAPHAHGHPLHLLHLRHAAHLRIAVGRHVRAIRRRQHRDRGTVHVRRHEQRDGRERHGWHQDSASSRVPSSPPSSAASSACVLAYMALHFRANQIIIGVVIVAFCTAMVQFMMDQVLEQQAVSQHRRRRAARRDPRPLEDPASSARSSSTRRYFVYLAIVLVALVSFMLFRTALGTAGPLGRREAEGRRDRRAERRAHPLRAR